MKCDKCLHSRAIVSENGIHCVCTLSSKTATKCLTGENDSFYARWKEKKLMTNGDRIRSMSDEELAEYLAQLGSDTNNGVIFSDRDYEWLEYLQMPWEEE